MDRDKKLPWSSCLLLRVLSAELLVPNEIFFRPEQYHAIKYNLSLGEMDAAAPVPDLRQKNIDVTLRSQATDV